MTRPIARSVDRPIPEWQEAIEFLQHTRDADLSMAFKLVVALRAAAVLRPRADGHLNPLWAHATRGYDNFERWLKDEALDA